MRILKISQKINKIRITSQKKKQDHDGSSKKVEEKGDKNSSLFCKVFKKTNHNAEKCWHKGKPNVTFVKSLIT